MQQFRPTPQINRYPKVVIFASLFTAAIVVGVLFRLFTPSASPIPENLPVLIPTPSAVHPKLTLNWKTTELPPTKQSKTYSHPTNAVSQGFIDRLVSQLHFTPQHKIDTKTTDILYVNGSKSLTINQPSGPLTFVDSSSLSPIKTGFRQADMDRLVMDKLQTLLDISAPLKVASTPRYYTGDQSVAAEIAQSVQYDFTVEIDGLPLISPSFTNYPITITLDNNLNLISLSIHGLFIPEGTGEVSKLFDFSQLQTIAPVAAQKLPSLHSTGTESQFESTSDVLLNVDDISLAYIYSESSQTLIPAFLLTGTAAPYGFRAVDTSYVVPATSN